MTQPSGKGSWLDVAAFTERVMGYLEPMIEEAFNRHGQESLDRQSIGWMNLQVLKHREYRDQRERRERPEQRRFINDQSEPDPTIPPWGAVNDLRIELNEVKGALDLLAKQLRESDERAEARDERLSNQVAYLIGGNAWEQPPKESWIGKPGDS